MSGALGAHQDADAGRARRGLDEPGRRRAGAPRTRRGIRSGRIEARAPRGRRDPRVPALSGRVGGGGLPGPTTAVRLDAKASGRARRMRHPDRRPAGSRPRPGASRTSPQGYHPHHTVWSWSAGVGKATDGRSVGWNLVSGINDPPELSERGIWVDGEPTEPGPVGFDGLEAIRFDEGSRLDFAGECERQREEKRFGVRYTYRQPLGAFRGPSPGGITLTSGLGRDGAPRRPLVAPRPTRGTRSPPSSATAAPRGREVVVVSPESVSSGTRRGFAALEQRRRRVALRRRAASAA